MSSEIEALSNEYNRYISYMNEYYPNIFEKIEKEESNLTFIYCFGKFFFKNEFRKLCKFDIEFISILVPTHVFGVKSSIKANFTEIYFDDSKESFYIAMNQIIIQVLTNKEK